MKLRDEIDKYLEQRRLEREALSVNALDDAAIRAIVENPPEDVFLLSVDDKDATGSYRVWFGVERVKFAIDFNPRSGKARLGLVTAPYKDVAPEQFWSNPDVLVGIYLQLPTG
jgi:hypothetical protein